MQKIITCFLIVLSVRFSSAQELPGGVIMENSKVEIGSGYVRQLFSKAVYFGPQTDWTIDGTLELWCQQIWIAPEALIKGAGKLMIYSPEENPYYPAAKTKATVIDGNNSNFIQVLVEHHNRSGIMLADIDDPGYAVSNPAGSDAARLNIGQELQLAKDGADVRLNGYNLGFSKNAVLSNYSNRRKLITDSDRGHVAKLLAAGTTFSFPVASGNLHYAPVTVAAADKEGTVYVQVVDRFYSPVQPKDLRFAIDLRWNIYSPDLMTTSLLFEHPDAVNNEKYSDEKAAVYQFEDAERLEKLFTKRIRLGMHQTGPISLLTNKEDYRSWFIKASAATEDLIIPNAFSPNGDGVNDRFFLVGLEAFDYVDVKIFNRWGNMLYNNSRYNNSWDGAGVNSGTYFYVITTQQGGRTAVHKGWVLLMD